MNEILEGVNKSAVSERVEPEAREAPLLTAFPGVVVTLVGALLAFAVAEVIPGLSALLVAIIAGALWRNIAVVPAALEPGIDVSAKHLLRAGIVLLGLQLSLGALFSLGAGVLVIVVASVGVTFGVTVWTGRLMGVARSQRLLIASGFSICGAAAVAATQPVARAKREEVATAIALVVLFGTLMIGLVPFLGGLIGLPEEQLGVWIGASTHEVAQVVAAGGAVGSTALAAAVAVKLARVLMLAPVIAGVSLMQRRHGDEEAQNQQRPPIVPLFVVGFLAAMVLRSTGVLPGPVLETLEVVQSVLLSAAMFALGLGVNIRALVRVGPKPLVLGLIATVTILVVSLVGTLLLAQ